MSSKVVILTGVSSGFGKSIAEVLSKNGYNVYGLSRRKIDIIDNINYYQADVTDAESIKKIIEEIYNKEKRIDVLINNAGMGIAGAIEDFSIEEVQLQMKTNFIGTFIMCKNVLPYLREQGHGHIINISSIGGIMGLPFQGFYSASKFAIEGFSEALRMELKPYNIKVTVVEPGDFATSFTKNRKIIEKYNNEKEFSNSPYYMQFQGTLSVIENDERNGLKPSYLAEKILRIIKSKSPSNRYIIASFEQKLAVLLKTLLPEKIFFKILESHYKI